MRVSTAAACCMLAFLLVALPVKIHAAGGHVTEAASSSERRLLVVNDDTSSVTVSDKAAPGSGEPQPVSGAAASSVGANFNPPQTNSDASATDTATAPDATQEVTMRSASQQQQQNRRRQRALGRKGGPELRQSAPGQAAAGISPGGGAVGSGSGSGSGGSAADPPRVFIGNLDDYALDFCQPTAGVVCSDRDKTSLLKSQPAIISLENAFPYAQVKPAVSYAGSSVTTLDFLGDTYSNRNQGVTKAALETVAGTEAVNSDTTVTTTALQGTVDASRVDRPIPDAVSVVAGRNAASGTYEWKSWVPRFTYQIGANYGLPVGLATVTDTSGK